MANRQPHTIFQRRGFTLLETLVALGIAATLIAALIPISRNTLFRIVTIDEQRQLNSILEDILQNRDKKVKNINQIRNGINLQVTAYNLKPFQYDKQSQEQWQPVLVTIEARSASGPVMRVEAIRLERVTP